MTQGKNMKASTLRLILIISLFTIGGLGAVGLSFTTDWLRDTATDAAKVLADAKDSQNDIHNLQLIQKELEKNREVVDRASSIVAESQSYQYQNQIIQDLTDYASRSGITIINFDFGETKQGASTTPATPPQPTAPKPAGVNSTAVSVTLKNPVDYTNLLRFIHAIEQNLTKMQISKIGLSKDPAGVKSDILTIEVYVR